MPSCQGQPCSSAASSQKRRRRLSATAGRLRGLRAASILNNVVLWGNDTADAIGGYASGEDMTAVGEKREIAVALEALYRLSKEEKA